MTNWTAVKTFPCGLVAFQSNSSGSVVIFAEIDGDFFKLSAMIRNPNKTAIELADSLYS